MKDTYVIRDFTRSGTEVFLDFWIEDAVGNAAIVFASEEASALRFPTELTAEVTRIRLGLASAFVVPS